MNFSCFSCFTKTRRRLYTALASFLISLISLAVFIFISFALTGTSEALYRFDDLYPPSGVGAQWMVITSTLDTGGSAAILPMSTIGEIADQRSSVRLQNGGINNEDILALFLVLPEQNGSMYVNFDMSYPNSYTQDVEADLLPEYTNTKESLAISSGTSKLFKLDFIKNAVPPYSSTKGYFMFHQNPANLPSQTLNIPFVIANVRNGTAEHNPLLFRAATRELPVGTTSATGATGNIVAYDRFTWNVLADKSDVGSDWIFVPVSDLVIDKNTVNYGLTTEVTNYTSLRYALQRYDGYGWGIMYPSRWAFDVPYDRELPSRINLDELSHIPPGLVTTYTQSYNVVSGVKDVLKIYPVDAPEQQSPRTLTLTHRSIFGTSLGTGGDTANPALYSATGFNLIPAGTNFFSKIAETMSVAGGIPLTTVVMPEQSDVAISGAISPVSLASDVISSMAVNAGIPGRLVSTEGSAGLLPLHVTFNLPRTNQLVSPKWDELLTEWRNSGNIKNLFARSFSLYFRNAWGENFDLSTWLMNQGIYDKTVKVFLDESRNVITVSFIMMMMDGKASQVKYVDDTTASTNNTYIVVMDGNNNNRWDLTLFTAPSNYVPTDETPNLTDSKSSSGCNIMSSMCLLFIIPLFLRKRSK